jgi:uncharacterized DUF497 family protein
VNPEDVMEYRFERDAQKERANLRKHGGFPQGGLCVIRIISARKATRAELRQYMGENT